MKIRIHVTKEILEKSACCDVVIRRRSENCAISVAINEIFPNSITVHEAIYPGFNSPNYNGLEIPLPPIAQAFILEFDDLKPYQRKKLPEFSFEIDIPMELVETIGIQEVDRILSESKTLEKV